MNEPGKIHSVNDVISSHYAYEDKISSVDNYEDAKDKEGIVNTKSPESTTIQHEKSSEQHRNAKNVELNCSETLCKINNRDLLSEDNTKPKNSHVIPQHDHRKIQSDTKDIEDDSRNNFVLEKKVVSATQINNMPEQALQNKIVQR